MKKNTSVIALLLAVLMVCCAFAACSSEKKSDTDSGTKTDTAVTEAADEPAIVDYSDIAVTIEDGDFDAMEDFIDNWDNYNDKVIKITGTSVRRMSNCSIMEYDGEGTGRGFSWEIIGGNFPDDYPAEDAKVTLVGVLTVTDEYGSKALMVPAENITVIE